MGGFRFLEEESIADIAFEAWGKTLPELFANAALALEEVQAHTNTIEPVLEKEIKKESPNLEHLLYDFLEELVFLKDKEGLLFSSFDVTVEHSRGKYKLRVKARGDLINPSEQTLRTDVKAVTMHEFKVEKVKEGYRAKVVLDV